MKICIVTHKVIKGDGQGRVNYEVTTEAIRCGYRVTLIASQIDPQLEQNELVDWIQISVKNLPLALLRNLAFSQQAARWLEKHRQAFNIVKINGAITNFPGDINAVHFVHSSWLKSPVHTWQQQKNLYGLYQLFYTAVNSYWEKQAFSRAKKIVAVSQQVKQELLAIGVPSAKIEVITNGVDLAEFTLGKGDCVASGQHRKSLQLPESVPLAFFVGDIRTPRKNLDTVLQALVKVPDLHLIVAGNTAKSPYPKLAKDLNISERTHFIGYRTDISELMQAVDMLVFPSRYEPFGMVVSEAMATGLPVITSSTVGAAEIVTPECGIVLADCEDVSALVAALKTLVGDRNLREQMGKAGRAIAQQHSWKNKAASYLNLFQELAKS